MDLDNVNAASFRCRECGSTFVRWIGQCPHCEKFGTVGRALATMYSSAPPVTISKPQGGSHVAPRVDRPLAGDAGLNLSPSLAARGLDHGENAPTQSIGAEAPQRELTLPVRITDVADDDLERIATGIEPLDRVLGGGLVPAGVYLLGGEPGAGKSTLLAQMIATVGLRCLYVTGEETIEKATIRARRVDATHPEIWIVANNDVDETIEHARRLAPAILAVDSIQTLSCADVGGVQGSVSQVKECTARLAAFANAENVIVVLIGHVTKDGELAGPNTLKHLVDVVLSLEGSEEFQTSRILRSSKNRFGSTAEIGVFQMTSDGLTWDTDDLIGEVTIEAEGRAEDR